MSKPRDERRPRRRRYRRSHHHRQHPSRRRESEAYEELDDALLAPEERVLREARRPADDKVEATREAVDEDGWMHSGDLATMDEEGYVAIVGRIKDMIIRGGENIYPREIEEFLISLPEIVEAYVVGVPSDRYGEEVMAFVRLAEGASPTEEELVAACKGTIATVKIPRFWRFVDEFPMTVTGKVQKFKLRELAASELEASQPV